MKRLIILATLMLAPSAFAGAPQSARVVKNICYKQFTQRFSEFAEFRIQANGTIIATGPKETKIFSDFKSFDDFLRHYNVCESNFGSRGGKPNAAEDFHRDEQMQIEFAKLDPNLKAGDVNLGAVYDKVNRMNCMNSSTGPGCTTATAHHAPGDFTEQSPKTGLRGALSRFTNRVRSLTDSAR